MAHVFKLTALLAEEQLAVIAEDGDGGHATLERNLVLFSDVLICVEVADVHVDHDEVGVDKRLVLFVVHVDIENAAVATPVAAKIEQHAPMSGRGILEGGGDVGAGLRGVGIDIGTGGAGQASGEDYEGGQREQLEAFQAQGLHLQVLHLQVHQLQVLHDGGNSP